MAERRHQRAGDRGAGVTEATADRVEVAPESPRPSARSWLPWMAAAAAILAIASVWARLKKGASVQDLQRDLPRCSYVIYRTVITLLDAGQIE